MLKILKIELSNLFIRPIEAAKIEIFPYPQEVYFIQNNRRIYLPSTVFITETNNYGNAETQLVPNDLLNPKPNFYVVKVMYKGKEYYFVAKITSDMNNIVYLHNVLVYPKQTDDSCSGTSNYRIVGENFYI